MLDEMIETETENLENLMDDPSYRLFYKRHMKRLERQQPLCRVTEKPTPAVKQDYWKSAMARAFAEMGK